VKLTRINMLMRTYRVRKVSLFRVSDQRTSKADRLLGSGPIEWLFMRGGDWRNAVGGFLKPLELSQRDLAAPSAFWLCSAWLDEVRI